MKLTLFALLTLLLAGCAQPHYDPDRMAAAFKACMELTIQANAINKATNIDSYTLAKTCQDIAKEQSFVRYEKGSSVTVTDGGTQ